MDPSYDSSHTQRIWPPLKRAHRKTQRHMLRLQQVFLLPGMHCFISDCLRVMNGIEIDIGVATHAGIDLGNLGALAAALGVNLAATQPDSSTSEPTGPPPFSRCPIPGANNPTPLHVEASSSTVPSLAAPNPHTNSTPGSEGLVELPQHPKTLQPPPAGGGQDLPGVSGYPFHGQYPPPGGFLPPGSAPPLSQFHPPIKQGNGWMKPALGPSDQPFFEPNLTPPHATSTAVPTLPGMWQPPGGPLPLHGNPQFPFVNPQGPSGMPHLPPAWPAPPPMGLPHPSSETPRRAMPPGGFVDRPSTGPRRNYEGSAAHNSTGRQQHRAGWGWGRGQPHN
jgi:hypothetical protein